MCLSKISCGCGDRKKGHKSSNFQMYKIDTKIINEKSSTSLILLLRSTLLWGWFFEILRLVNIDISTTKKTTLLLKKPFRCVLKQT